MEQILIVEDSKALQRILQRLFEADAFEVETASDALCASRRFSESRPCVVVLDLKLPDRPGRELCREFKSSAPEIPIVVLSANTETEDKVSLFKAGADDYVTKPFSPRELLARVRRAMRRAAEVAVLSTESDTPSAYAHNVLTFSDVHVNFTTKDAHKAGQQVVLTAQEFKVLRYLSLAPGRTISRAKLLDELWECDAFPTTRTIDNHVLRLRQKLESDPANPQHFISDYGAGYRFLLKPGATEGNP